ncbi:N-alpha-acetyltransferase 25, NatB auxiliary subunit [Balamuthia mandrillaris]
MNTYLKKHPNSKLGKAWKAIALERNGDREEAYQLIQEVQQEYPLEDLLLHYIKVALKKMGQVHDITLLQEKLFEKEPNNQHLGEEVFFAYVREHDLKNQQLVALRLFKHFKKEKHYYWSIASNYIQAELALRKLQDNPPTDEKEKETILNDNKRLLSLCEMMIRKKFSESPPKKLPVFLFLVNVLLAQNKHEAALKEICNEAVAPLFLPHDHLQWQLKLLTRLERWEECSQLYKQLLTVKEPDDWGYYTGYMNAMFELRKGQEGSITDDALPFFHEFQEKYSHCRGPFLAEIELEHRLIAAGIIPSRDNLKALLVNYFRRFGHKYCCYQDMRSYLAYLSPEERSSFCETLHQAIPVLSEEEDLAKKENRYHSLSSYEQVCRRLDQHRSIITSASREEGEALANRLWSLYMESTQIGSKKEETENGHGDDLALLSAYVLVDIYRHRNEQKYLLAAIVLLEYLLTQSKHNFQAKLLLINLYSRIGTMHRAKDLFHSMHIKHIQLDSLTHLILHPLINGGFSEEALEICRKIRRFHAARTEEIPDLLAGPYRSQNYQKITEFLSFESRLERSQQLAITVTEEVLLHVQSNPSLDKAVQYFSSDWYLRFPPKFHRSNGAEPTASSAYYFYARRMLDLSPNQDRNILLMVQSIEEEGEHEKQDTKKKEEEQEEKKNFYVLDGRSGATSADVDSRNFTKQVHWLKARSVVAKLLSVHFTELIPSSPAESQSGASSQKATSSASSGSKQKRGAAASTKSQQKGEASNNSKEEQQEKESVSAEQLMAELKASLLVVLSDETLDATKIKDAMAETSKACTEASTVSPDITLFDHWGWTYIFYLFTASQSIHNLAKSFQQEGSCSFSLSLSLSLCLFL